MFRELRAKPKLCKTYFFRKGKENSGSSIRLSENYAKHIYVLNGQNREGGSLAPSLFVIADWSIYKLPPHQKGSNESYHQ